MHKLHQCSLDPIRDVIRQAFVILNLIAVELKLHIQDAQVCCLCII